MKQGITILIQYGIKKPFNRMQIHH